MRTIRLVVCCLPWLAACAPQEAPAPAPTPAPTPPEQPSALPTPLSSAILFEGGRLIVGDGGVVENAAFLVENGRFTEVGLAGAVEAPAGASRVDLTGKTVMPAIIDGHCHLGYADIRAMTDVRANYSRENIIDHLHRSAYYGLGAAMSMGIDPLDMVGLREEEIADAARFRWAGRGIGRPNAGPGATDRRDVVYGVDTPEEGRAAIRELAANQVDLVKLWVDDRNGTVPKLTPDLYGPIIDEAHRLGLRVTAHIFYLEDAKDLLRAGIDGFAHGVRDVDVDDEFMELLARRPYTFLIPNLPDSGDRTTDDLPFIAETLPTEAIDEMRTAIAEGIVEDPEEYFQVQARNLARMYEAGVPVILGTDGGGAGWDAHEEIADMVTAGMSPADALVAATSNAARLLRLHDLGAVADGKSADFVVLDANPLDDIKNTRAISNVYIRGMEVDRAALAADWTG